MTMLDFNTGINFGAKGNLNEYSPVGFSDVPDAVSRWSDASLARLTFRLPFLRHDAQFTIEVFPFLADGLIRSRIAGCISTACSFIIARSKHLLN
jgi:hypothetical protein